MQHQYYTGAPVQQEQPQQPQPQPTQPQPIPQVQQVMPQMPMNPNAQIYPGAPQPQMIPQRVSDAMKGPKTLASLLSWIFMICSCCTLILSWLMIELPSSTYDILNSSSISSSSFTQNVIDVLIIGWFIFGIVTIVFCAMQSKQNKQLTSIRIAWCNYYGLPYQLAFECLPQDGLARSVISAACVLIGNLPVSFRLLMMFVGLYSGAF